MKLRTVVGLMVLWACGPEAGVTSGDAGLVDGLPAVDVLPPGTGEIRGQVWAPGNAPGQVAPGYEIPVAGALVHLSSDGLPQIPQHAHCEQCIDRSGYKVLADAKGVFRLSGLASGNYILTVQKGQFRVESEITVADDQVLALSASYTTLPSEHAPDRGKWIPRIALAIGAYDRLEDLLAKMGMGALDAQGAFIPDSAVGVYDIYRNSFYEAEIAGGIGSLVSDLDQMLQYHIILIPCSTEQNRHFLLDQQVLRNIRDYVAAGGKLFVTDWSGEWADNVFPAYVNLGAGTSNGLLIDTPAEAYDRESDTWDLSLLGVANSSKYTSYHAEVVDADTQLWLDGQFSLQYEAPTAPTDATEFAIYPNWNTIWDLQTVTIGTDADGDAIIDEPKVHVIGDRDGDLPKRPLTVTYQGAGCGRVLYSTFHTTELGSHLGLYPQERLLIHMLMGIGECVESVVIE